MRETFVGTEVITQRNDVGGRPSPASCMPNHSAVTVRPHAFEVATRQPPTEQSERLDSSTLAAILQAYIV